MASKVPPAGEEEGGGDIPSSSSEDGLESLGSVPAPAQKRVAKSYAVAAVEPAPQKESGGGSSRRQGEGKGSGGGGGGIPGGKFASKSPKGKRKQKGMGSRGGGGDEVGKEPGEPITPQKAGEASILEGVREEEVKEAREEDKGGKGKLVSGDHANARRIRFAPLKIPLKRRLQTAAVLWHTFAIAIFVSLFWFLLAIPLTWPLLIPYLIYVLFSNAHRDGTSPIIRSHFLRSLPMWRLYTGYFPIRLHRTTMLSPDRNYILAYHPHGIISHGAFGNFCTEGTTGWETLFPGITNTLLTLDANFRIPFYRDYLLKMGLASVSRRSCESLLRGEAAPKIMGPKSWLRRALHPPPTPPSTPDNSSGGHAITIVIGGARESLLAIPGTTSLVIRRRRGFLKLAIRENAGVVPVLSFGENDLYDQVIPDQTSLVRKVQVFIKKTAGFTVPLFHARGVFNYDVGILPYRREVNSVVGRPIFPKEQNDHPRDVEVDEMQERYIAELQRLWDEWKDVFAKNRAKGAKGELVVVE